MAKESDDLRTPPGALRIAALQRLAELASDSAPREWKWDEADRPQLWMHQLAAPIAAELARFDPAAAIHVSTLLAAHAAPPVHALADLLSHPAPDASLLNLLNAALVNERNRRPVATTSAPDLFRAVAAAVALLAHARGDLSARDGQLHDDARWLLQQNWIDAQTRGLAIAATSKLDADRDR